MKSYKKLSFIVPKYLVSILVSSNLMLCGSFVQCIMISYFLFSIQDVWTELGRPCGIHQKQVLLSFHKSVDDLLRILDKFLIFYIIESGILAVICKLPEDGFPFKLYICLIQCLLSIYYLCYLLMVLMEGDFACNTGWPNGNSLCLRSSPTDNSLWWLLLQLFWSWFGHTIWWTGTPFYCVSKYILLQ